MAVSAMQGFLVTFRQFARAHAQYWIGMAYPGSATKKRHRRAAQAPHGVARQPEGA